MKNSRGTAYLQNLEAPKDQSCRVGEFFFPFFPEGEERESKPQKV